MFENAVAEMKDFFTSEVKRVHTAVDDLRAEVLELPESTEQRLVGAFKEALDMTKNEFLSALNDLKTEVVGYKSAMEAKVSAAEAKAADLQKKLDAAGEQAATDADLSSAGDIVKGITDTLKGDSGSASVASATGTGFDSVQQASTTKDKPPVVMSQLPASTLAASGGIKDENPALTPSPVANTTV